MRTAVWVGGGAALGLALLALGVATCASVETEARRPPEDPADALADDRLADKVPQEFDPERVYDVPCGEDGDWVENRSAAVMRLDVPMLRADEDRDHLVLVASYADAARRNRSLLPILPSINAVDGKAKQFDDGLVAALDLACFDGVEGRLVGRVEIVRRLYEAVGPRSDAAPLLAAALQLAGEPVEGADETEVGRLLDEFEADEVRSKPIGFYTWNERLGRVFRFSRFLQHEERASGFPGSADLAAALAADAALRDAYARSVGVDRGAHNPPACGSLLDAGDPSARVAVLPPHSTREFELLVRLFPRGLPPGTNLMTELVRRIRSGEVDLAPRPDGGWLDRQVFALETLLLPERADERDKLLLTKSYKKRMLEAFQALLVKRLETHVKGAMVASEARAPRSLPPTLRVEPCATYALRTARAYAFLEAFLVAELGEETLRSLRGLREGGDRGTDLLHELRSLRDLFYGIHLVSAADVGMRPSIAADEPVDRGACFAAALAWLAQCYEDPDLAIDTRVSVPVWADQTQTRLWATLGVRLVPLDVSWARPPKMRPADGSEDWRDAPWGETTYAIPTDDFAEIRLRAGRVLTRDELRAACGSERTREEILADLE